MHMDDFLWSGIGLFDTRTIDNTYPTFHCGKENAETFQNIALNIKHSSDGILLSQYRYANEYG